MKKTTLITCCLIMAMTHSWGQGYRMIIDRNAVIAIAANHSTQWSALKLIENDNKQIAGYNEKISVKMVQVYAAKQKLFDSLKDTKAIKSNGRDVEHIYKIISDIGKYQQRMLDYAAGDPELVVVAAKTELELISKTLSLLDYVTTAVTDNDNNLLDNTQRMDLLKTIIQDLRVMRGMAYSICRQMKTAKRNGLLQALAPGYYGYPNNGNKIKKEILENYNTGRKK